MKRFTALILSAALCLGLCGCGGVFDREYVSVEDYTAPAAVEGDSDKINVSSFEELKKAIMEFVSMGEDEGSIRFDPTYTGESAEDMASACWQIRTQDALCAYCVENISYELKKIVNYTEADLHISYAGGDRNAEDVVKLQYTTGIKTHIEKAFFEGASKLAVLVARSSYSADEIAAVAEQVYRSNPGISPVKPKVNVNLFSGSGSQKLYEFNIDYSMSREDFKARQTAMGQLELFDDVDIQSTGEGQRALIACEYLRENSSYSKDSRQNSIYSALISGSSDSEGLAFAYIELCRRLGLECSIVYGQYEWVDYCWNIVKAEGEYYHVDVASCIEDGIEGNFLLNDQQMWAEHRWDLSSYPKCEGQLNYSELK